MKAHRYPSEEIAACCETPAEYCSFNGSLLLILRHHQLPGYTKMRGVI